MTCDEVRGLLAPFADGELDLVGGLEIERHLEGCPACAAALERARSLSALLGGVLYHQPPADLEGRIRVSLRRAAGVSGRPASLLWRRLGAAAAAAVFAAFALWGLLRGLSAPSARELLEGDLIAAHVRSLLADHLVDRKSSDRHEVKPWFLGQVDFAPEVKDLAKQGFPLVGGRLDYVGGRRVAALVYRRHKHVINVFIWRVEGEDDAPEYLERQGFHLLRWTDNGRRFWVVSDLDGQELRRFAELLRH